MAVSGKKITEVMTELGLNDVQQKFLRQFSQLRSARQWEKNALAIIGTPELVKDWFYGGFWDTGYFGGGKCTNGHTLRYEHVAKNKITGEEVIFGVKCVQEFFELTEQQLKLITKGVKEVNEEVMRILDKLSNYKTFDNYIERTKYDEKLATIKAEGKTCFRQDEIEQLLAHKLPLTYGYEREVSRIYDNIVWERKRAELERQRKEREQAEQAQAQAEQQAKVKAEEEQAKNELQSVVEQIKAIPEVKFLRFGTFDEKSLVMDIVKFYETKGRLSDKQLAVLKKSVTRHEKDIPKAM